jgi:hypothetical protein
MFSSLRVFFGMLLWFLLLPFILLFSRILRQGPRQYGQDPMAQLINRGEEFQFFDGHTYYEGTCLWSWEDVPGEGKRRTGPIYIYASSIVRRGVAGLVPLGLRRKIDIARRTREFFMAKGMNSSLEFVVVEDIPKRSESLE